MGISPETTSEQQQQPLVNQNANSYHYRCPACNAKLERLDREGPFRLVGGEEEDTSRVLVRVTAYRWRLTDKSNLFPKYFVDCLRYAGFLRDDGPKQIEEEIRQVKVDRKEDERTELELIYPSDELLQYHNPKPLF